MDLGQILGIAAALLGWGATLAALAVRLGKLEERVDTRVSSADLARVEGRVDAMVASLDKVEQTLGISRKRSHDLANRVQAVALRAEIEDRDDRERSR